MRAHPRVLLGDRFERELKRKVDRYRFQIERRLKTFNDWPAQIVEGDRATQKQTV
jgi:hypothetical protein